MSNIDIKWIYCPCGKGYLHDSGDISTRMRHFKENAVGIVKANKDELLTV